MTTLQFGKVIKTSCSILVIGEKDLLNLSSNASLRSLVPAAVPSSVTESLYFDLGSNKTGGQSSAYHVFSEETTRKQITFTVLNNETSRYNGIIRSDAVQEIVAKSASADVDTHIIFCLKNKDQAFPVTSAIARCFPLYSRKSKKAVEKVVSIDFLIETGDSLDYSKLEALSNAVRFAARLTDMPASELHTDAYVEEARGVYERLKSKGVEIMVKKGHTLELEGFGGLWGVGKASENLPALVVLSYKPANSTKKIAWVGKGIVYDTGGLSIKGKDYMPTMKCDMAGSAAMLAAFEAVVSTGCNHELYAILCIAENSVDSKSTRPDDILTLYSGKTVEINNTDAEGRLVLADGVAYATKVIDPDYILDMATLTGAQSYATGKAHSGVLSNDDGLEKLLVECGKFSGDLTFPLLYAPELLGISKQFTSEVADMKNSVKDRANASSSCAGHFIEENLVGEKWKWNSTNQEKGKWAHLDIAAPAFVKDRGTGYGVAILMEFIKRV